MTLATEPELALTVLTHSSEACFKTCARKYYLRYEKGYRTRHSSNPLRAGGAFHAGIEPFKRGKGLLASLDAVNCFYADTGCPPWLTPEEFEVERHTALAMVGAYCAHYTNDAIVEYVAVELPFEVPIINPRTGRPSVAARSAGKIDAIVKLPDGRLAVQEEKTVGHSIEPDADYWKRLLMDGQISRYFLAARDIGHPVETVVYYATRKPAISPKKIEKAYRALATSEGRYFGVKLTDTCPERETPEMFGARLKQDMLDRPAFYFARMEIPRIEADLTDYRYEQWTTQRAMRHAQLDARFVGAAAFPRNTGACLMYGRCEYLDCCRGLAGNPDETIPDGFVVVADRHPELSIPEAGADL